MKFTSALTQVTMVGIIAFTCPGLFNAMTGLGGAGAANPSAANAANTALYTTFAIFGILGGLAFNVFGNRVLMCFGGLTYAFYAASMYIVGHIDGTKWVAILGGAILGIGAGLFWTSQGAMMLAYATPDRKGKYIAIFWTIFNLGGCMGGLLAFALNFNSTSSEANPASYFTFVALMCAGSVLSIIALVPPHKVIREDGEMVKFENNTDIVGELRGTMMACVDINMLYMATFFLVSNWYYTYQLNYLNGFLFSIRTRGFNSAFYWGVQMLAAHVIGALLDWKSWSVRKRGVVSFAFTTVLMVCMWAGCIAIQYAFEEGYDKDQPPAVPIDIGESARCAGPMFVLFLGSFADACLQAFCYWMMGAIARGDTSMCARFAGFYKGVQSAGAAVSWALDLHQSYTTQLWIGFGLWILGTILCVPAVTKLQDEIVVEYDDVKYAHAEPDTEPNTPV